MPQRGLFWQLIPVYGLVTLAIVLVVGWLTLRQFDKSYLAAKRSDLEAMADFLDGQLGAEVSSDQSQFARLAQRFSATTGIRVVLVSPDARVTSDSRNRPEDLERQLTRPEMRAALAGQRGTAVRYSPGLDERILDLTQPVMRDDKLRGVLYLSAPLGDLDQALGQLQAWLLMAGVALAIASLVLARWRARAIALPLGQLSQTLGRLSAGEWSARATVPDSRELAQLAAAVNSMAERLQRQIGVLNRQNKEQQAVLASMAEGVLAVDSQERVISLNNASGRLLGLDPAQARDRRLQEVVRNADLSRFISRVLACQQEIDAEVLLHGERERVMHARGSALDDADGRPIGAVIVLNDVTDFRRLEDIRRDFVANVSHELKTPITSIKGFVETLLDGALRNPEDAERFLRIVAKQADRLHAIIEDLLSLSKIEQDEDHDEIALVPTAIRTVLESAIHACQVNAQEHAIQVTLECDPQLQASVNAPLLEQAVVNLIDNAIKYSEPRGQVKVAASAANGEVRIDITDRGCGIAGEHLSRIFERFYRVDRARSRKLGGTGLGLAIVKHIAQAHHGRVTVDSALGVGSTFTVYVPRSM